MSEPELGPTLWPEQEESTSVPSTFADLSVGGQFIVLPIDGFVPGSGGSWRVQALYEKIGSRKARRVKYGTVIDVAADTLVLVID